MSEGTKAPGGLRIVLAGAAGALGTEVVAALADSTLQIDEFVPVATERSIGAEIDFRGEVLFVESSMPSLKRADLLVVCTPKEAALELVREALRAEVPCIDCSGALLGSPEIPVVVSELSQPKDVLRPVLMTPSGVATAWGLVLSEIQRAAGLRRVVGTVMQPITHIGRAGIEVLSSETIALLSQTEEPESEVFPGPVAFDCVSVAGPPTAEPGQDGAESGANAFELRVESELRELLGAELAISVTAVQVPIFVGEGSNLVVETERPLAPQELIALLEKAPGIDLRAGPAIAPSTRETAGRDEVLVGRIRRDPSCGSRESRERGLLLWLAADGLRLVAANVAKIVETRFRLH